MSGTRNKLADLNNHLFEQLERLNDETLNDDGLKDEILRSKAIEGIAKTIINNGNLVLNAQKFHDDKLNADIKLPRMLNGDD